MSMFPLPVAVAAEDSSPAELLSRVMPPPTPAIGFEDRRSLTDFVRRSTKEKDVAVRALGLSNLGRADINGDHCLTHREYSLYLGARSQLSLPFRASHGVVPVAMEARTMDTNAVELGLRDHLLDLIAAGVELGANA